MSKCPFSGAQPPAQSGGKCPFSGGQAPPADQEMCSHGRKKLEEEQRQQAAQEGLVIPEGEAKTWSNDQLKEHFTSAYNCVGKTGTSRLGDADIAAILVGIMGYSKDELDVIGADVRLMQGTGNPHRYAKLQPGETVVDLGSGFGIDAFLAGSRVGTTGRVIGVDLSITEIQAALKRVSERQVRNVDFRLGDIEACPVYDNSADCVISNGGFCLVPNKPLAFREIYRILKPGGRFSISCTVRKHKELDMSLNWPSCMVVFMPLPGAKEMLEGIGFADVVVDDTNSKVDLWDEKEMKELDKEKAEEAKVTIHRGDPQYEFLNKMDMNEYFARVNIFGRKPL